MCTWFPGISFICSLNFVIVQSKRELRLAGKIPGFYQQVSCRPVQGHLGVLIRYAGVRLPIICGTML
jgi:hypothetical protein